MPGCPVQGGVGGAGGIVFDFGGSKVVFGKGGTGHGGRGGSVLPSMIDIRSSNAGAGVLPDVFLPKHPLSAFGCGGDSAQSAGIGSGIVIVTW